MELTEEMGQRLVTGIGDEGRAIPDKTTTADGGR